MNKKKTIIAAIVLLLVLLVGGVIAFFTDDETLTNTFTIGKVDIELTEPSFDPTKAQNVLPGTIIAKDPTVTVAEGSADAYVFMEVQVPCFGDIRLFDYTANDGWYKFESGYCTDGVATDLYAFGKEHEMTRLTAGQSVALFSQVILAETLDNTYLEVKPDVESIVINAYAVQADNMDGYADDIFANNFRTTAY